MLKAWKAPNSDQRDANNFKSNANGSHFGEDASKLYCFPACKAQIIFH